MPRAAARQESNQAELSLTIGLIENILTSNKTKDWIVALETFESEMEHTFSWKDLTLSVWKPTFLPTPTCLASTPSKDFVLALEAEAVSPLQGFQENLDLSPVPTTLIFKKWVLFCTVFQANVMSILCKRLQPVVHMEDPSVAAALSWVVTQPSC
ncbi:hypothetical protein E5288_WYG022577 [Bos mutus]|uniref:Uncharacterized protein n=1 Tax=Bos mutus TaxID=72004 RepID=A0A6B0R4T0_9CETA|nr:hypothetical protein [Bos mutus]